MHNGFCFIDDKHVPLYRVMWVSDVPHFCGSDECDVEGHYEVRLEHGESVWASQNERDQTVAALQAWQSGDVGGSGESWE